MENLSRKNYAIRSDIQQIAIVNKDEATAMVLVNFSAANLKDLVVGDETEKFVKKMARENTVRKKENFE